MRDIRTDSGLRSEMTARALDSAFTRKAWPLLRLPAPPRGPVARDGGETTLMLAILWTDRVAQLTNEIDILAGALLNESVVGLPSPEPDLLRDLDLAMVQAGKALRKARRCFRLGRARWHCADDLGRSDVVKRITTRPPDNQGEASLGGLADTDTPF